MRATRLLLLLATCFFIAEPSWAQQPEIPLASQAGTSPPFLEQLAAPEGPGSVTDSLCAGLPGDCPPSGAYASAMEAAAVDPGILVFPDTSVNAKILQIKPPENVDPKMIVPRDEERRDKERQGQGER